MTISDLVDERIAAEQKEYVMRIMLFWKKEIQEIKGDIKCRDSELRKRVERYEKYSAMSMEDAYDALFDAYGDTKYWEGAITPMRNKHT